MMTRRGAVFFIKVSCFIFFSKNAEKSLTARTAILGAALIPSKYEYHKSVVSSAQYIFREVTDQRANAGVMHVVLKPNANFQSESF